MGEEKIMGLSNCMIECEIFLANIDKDSKNGTNSVNSTNKESDTCNRA